MENFWKSAIRQVLVAALAAAAFYLFAAALFAVAVRALDPPQAVVTAVNWTLKGVGSFAFSLLFVRKTRALWKGVAAGVLSCLVTMLLFAAIGGGFRLTVFFPLELLLMAAAGGLGALLGAKLRKED